MGTRSRWALVNTHQAAFFQKIILMNTYVRAYIHTYMHTYTHAFHVLFMYLTHVSCISCVVHVMCCYFVIIHDTYIHACMHVSDFFRHSREQARSRRHAAFSRESFGACDGGARRWQ